MRVTWIIFIGTFWLVGIFLTGIANASSSLSFVHSDLIPNFSKELVAVSGWIWTAFTVSTLTHRSTLAASLPILATELSNSTDRESKKISSKSKIDLDDDDSEEDSGKPTIKNRARLLIGTLNKNNCFAKVLCGLGSKPPSTKTELLNDYVYLMNDLLSDDESKKTKKTSSKTRTRTSQSSSSSSDKHRGSPYVLDEEFDHEDDEPLDNFSREFDYSQLSDMADEELANEEGPGVLSYIMKEAKNRIPHLKLRVGRSVPDNVTSTATTNSSSIASKPTPSPEMGSEESNTYVRRKKAELKKTQDVEQTLNMAAEAGDRLRSPRQCRLLFDECPFETDQISEILGNLRKILQGQPVQQPSTPYYPAFAPMGVLTTRPTPIITTGGQGPGTSNVDKVEIVVHLNGAKQGGHNVASATAVKTQTPFSPPMAIPASVAVPQAPGTVPVITPVSEAQPPIPLPSEQNTPPLTHTITIPQSVSPMDSHTPQYPQQIAPQVYPQPVLPQVYPQPFLPQAYPPQTVPQLYPQIPQMTQPVTQDKIIDFLQGVLEHNGNAEPAGQLVPKNDKKTTILIDGKEVPINDYLVNLKKTLQTLAQMNKLALATEAQIVAKDAANGDTLSDEEEYDDGEDVEGLQDAFPEIFSHGPDLGTFTDESDEESDKVVKLKPAKKPHQNQSPSPGGTKPTRKPWGQQAIQDDDPFEDSKEEKRKDTGSLIDKYIADGISQPRPKEERQKSKKKRPKIKGQSPTRRKKKPKPTNESQEEEYEEAKNTKKKRKKKKSEEETSREDSEEGQRDEESNEDDEVEQDRPPLRQKYNPKVKVSLAQPNNPSTTADPYLPSPAEQEKINQLTDILLPGSNIKPKGNKINKGKGGSNSRVTQSPKVPVNSNFNQEFEKISTNIGGKGTSIVNIDEFSENSDKVPKFKKSKRKRRPIKKPNSEEVEEEEEEELADEEEYEEETEEGDENARRVSTRQKTALIAMPYQEESEDDGRIPTQQSSTTSLQTNIVSYLVGLTGVKPVNPGPTENPGQHPFAHYDGYRPPYKPNEKPSDHPFAFYQEGYKPPDKSPFGRFSKPDDHEDDHDDNHDDDHDSEDDNEDVSDEEKGKKKKKDDKKVKKKDKKKDEKHKKKDSDENHSSPIESHQMHYNTHSGQHDDINDDYPSKTKGVYLSMTMHDDGFPLTPDAYELALPIPNLNDGFISGPAPEEQHYDQGHQHLQYPQGYPSYLHHHAPPHHHPHHHQHHHQDSDDSDEHKDHKKKDKKKDKKKKDKKKKKKKGDKDHDGEDSHEDWSEEYEDDDNKDSKEHKDKKKDKKKHKDDDDDEHHSEEELADLNNHANAPLILRPEAEPIHQALQKVIPGYGQQPPPQGQSQFSNPAQNNQQSGEKRGQFGPPPHMQIIQQYQDFRRPGLPPPGPPPEDDEDESDTNSEETAEPPVTKDSNRRNSVFNSTANHSNSSNSTVPTVKPKRMIKYKSAVMGRTTTTFRPKLRNPYKSSPESEEDYSESKSADNSQSPNIARPKTSIHFDFDRHRSDFPPMQQRPTYNPQSAAERNTDMEDARSGMKSNKKGERGRPNHSHFSHPPPPHFNPSSHYSNFENSGPPPDGLPALRLPDTRDPYYVHAPDGHSYPVYEDSHRLTVLPLPDLNKLFSGFTNFGGQFNG